MGRRKAAKTKKVRLRLTAAERSLLLDSVAILPVEIEEVIRNTPPTQPLMLTIDDLGELESHIAAESSHTKDQKLQRRLDAISEKILKLLDRHGDESQVTRNPTAISFFERLATMLVGPGPLVEPLPTKSDKGEDQYGVKLTDKQRQSILHCTELVEELRSKIQQAGAGTQTLGFTKDELDELASEVDLAAFESRTPHKQRLAAVYEKLEILTDALAVDESDEAGRSHPDRRSTIYQFKITLCDSQPPIWRRIQVPDLTLGELHDVLQVVMGWENCHMHQFILNGKHYGEAEPDALDLEVADEDDIQLSQIFTGRKKPRLVYEYDFGDSWQHEIRLEKVSEPEPKVKYPRCVEGARACPPEDCGGAWGYAEFLEAISDKKHPDHRDMKEWIGRKFDPEKFSTDKVNRELKRLR